MAKNKIIIGLVILLIIDICFLGFEILKRSQDKISEHSSSSLETLLNYNLKQVEARGFGSSVKHDEAMNFKIASTLSNNFSISEIKNIEDMEEAYGLTFSEADLKFLEENKFLIKNLYQTNIKPDVGNVYSEYYREFLGLYNRVAGSADPHDRGQKNSVFFSSDIFLHSYQLLFVELLKEAENKVFIPAMRELTQKFFGESSKKMELAKDEVEKAKWQKVRNYFVVPYALLSTSLQPLGMDDYLSGSGGSLKDPSTVQSDFDDRDKSADDQEKVVAFIQDLNLDNESQSLVLSDIEKIYQAQNSAVPAILAQEYEKYKEDTRIGFSVDFSQFNPRSHYTNNSYRRQYFRAITWFTQQPFFLKSDNLTGYAFAIAQLFAENEQQLKDYSQLEETINYLVGTSDDLMPIDYLRAISYAKNRSDKEEAVMEYLAQTKNPKIKATPASYDSVGSVESSEVKLLTKGMRFFSGKFIIDSYWTDYLTQGDEAIQPGYTQKLPPMASSLEIMNLLGSDYAGQQIKNLNFYKPGTKEAIDQAMAELVSENKNLTADFWQSNIYNGWLWTAQSLFDWQKENKNQLPTFMQSPKWEIKTLMTGSGFWTELRHATLLYAKQSFAELGGGPGCDEREIPAPPKGYVEPQFQTYKRLATLAKRTAQGLEGMGFELDNLAKVDSFVEAVNLALSFTERELQDKTFSEKTKTEKSIDINGDPCVSHSIDGNSDWENIRLKIIDKLEQSLPRPSDGPILPAKDKRSAIIADVHTGGDSSNPHQVLYEGVGVPKVIFVAVKDSNGARLTIGFTYSHYEFTKDYANAKRLTDEDWQSNFYQTAQNESDAFTYQPASVWPQESFWYQPLFIN